MKKLLSLTLSMFLAIHILLGGTVVSAQEMHTLANIDELSAAAYLVMDVDSGEVLYSDNMDRQLPPASMTKLLTSLTLLSDPEFDPDKPVTFSEHAVTLPSSESVNAGYEMGETTSTYAAYNNMMIGSANDCARALAETYGGSEEGFLEKMNQKAEEIGCTNTYFTDVCGFNSGDHYTTAEDIAKILKANMQYPLYREVAAKKIFISPATDVHTFDGWHTMANTNKVEEVAKDLGTEYFKSIDGGKTGSTGDAGECLIVTATTNDDRHLTAVIFDTMVNQSGQRSMYSRQVAVYRLLEAGAEKLGVPAVANSLEAKTDKSTKTVSTEPTTVQTRPTQQQVVDNGGNVEFSRFYRMLEIRGFKAPFIVWILAPLVLILLLALLIQKIRLQQERHRSTIMYQRLKHIDRTMRR